MLRLREATAQIPDTTGTIWASARAMSHWEPRIQAISRIWRDVELGTVFSGMRDASIVTVSPNELVGFTKKVVKNKCSMTVLGKLADTGHYSSGFQEPAPGQLFNYRIAVHRENEYFEDNVNNAIALLAYPICCAHFFQKYWINEGFIDLTYPQYLNTENFLPGANVIYKCIGVRPVFHLPCSFDCGESIKLASQIGYLMKDMGLSVEHETIQAFTEMPVEWSALHGYAEIRTPVIKIVTKTEATPVEYKFQLSGVRWPIEGVEGNKFPWNQRKSLPEKVVVFNNNGFISDEAQKESHQWLLKELSTILVNERKALVDLGCGDGTLLYEISKNWPNLKLSGVDVSLDKVKIAQRILGHEIQVDCKNIFQYGSISKDYILVAEQRFQENFHLAEKLQGTVICYNYSTRKVYTWNSAMMDLETLKKLIESGDKPTLQNSDSQMSQIRSSPVSLIVKKELEDSGLSNYLPKESSS